MTDDRETVFICSEGRPWRRVANGDFERIPYSEVKTEPTDNKGFRRVVGHPTRRKPYDDKNGF